MLPDGYQPIHAAWRSGVCRYRVEGESEAGVRRVLWRQLLLTQFLSDTTNTAHPGTIIGYGGPGSPNTNNRSIQEVTFDWVQTFGAVPRYGALQTTRSIPT